MALLAACEAGQAPQNKIAVDYGFASYDGTMKSAGIAIDSQIRSWAISYEFLPIAQRGSVGVSYYHREEEPDAAGVATIESDILALRLMDYSSLGGDFQSFLGALGGWVFNVDGAPGSTYNDSFFYGLEGGVEYSIGTNWGIRGGVSWIAYEAQGAGFTPDTDIDGLSFFAGAFLDFGR